MRRHFNRFALITMITALAPAAFADESCTDWSSTLRPLQSQPYVLGHVCEADGDFIYTAGERFSVVSVDDHGVATIVGDTEIGVSDTWAGMVILPPYAYLLGTGYDIIQEVDIGDPTAPTPTRYYYGGAQLYDIETTGGRVIVLGEGVQIHVLDTESSGQITATVVPLPDIQYCSMIGMSGTLLLTKGNYITCFDLSDPFAPAPIGQLDYADPTRASFIGDEIYYSERYYTHQGEYELFYSCRLAPDGSFTDHGSLPTLPSLPVAVNGQFLIFPGDELTIMDRNDSLETIRIPGGSDIVFHGDILCILDPDTGLRTWRLPETPAIMKESTYFDAPGVGYGQDGHWIMERTTYTVHSSYPGGYSWRADYAVFDISNPMAAQCVDTRFLNSYSQDSYNLGTFDCFLTGSRWALYQTYDDTDSWRAVDHSADTDYGYVSGTILNTSDNLVWVMNSATGTLALNELLVGSGAQQSCAFDFDETAARNLKWLDATSALLLTPGVKTYDFSDQTGYSISSAWPPSVPTDVEFIDHRDRVAYVRSLHSLYAVDFTDLSAPVLLDEMTIGAQGTAGTSSDVLALIESDGIRIAILDSMGGFTGCSDLIEGQYEAAIVIDGHAYIHDGSNTLCYDLSDLEHPEYVGIGTGGTGGLMLKDGYLIDNAGAYLPHCSTTTPTCLQTFDAIRDGTRVNLTAALYGDLDGELVLRRETTGTDPVELARQPLPADGRASWTDPTPPSSAITYMLEFDGARLGTAAVPAAELPRITRLLPNVPNPFNPKTTLRYEMSRPGHAELTLYDARGRRVVTLLDEDLPAGAGAVDWDGRDAKGRLMPSGSYLAAFESDEGRKHHKLMLTR